MATTRKVGKTRNGVYNNIMESDYSYNTDKFIFFFSSLSYKNKFSEALESNRENLMYKISSRYCIKILMYDYFDFILYDSIEQRGFKVKDMATGEVITCLEQVTLDGEIKTSKQLTEQLGTLTVNSTD